MSGRYDPRQDDREAADLDPDTIDTGEPIAQLKGLEEPAPSGFLGRLRRRIDRTKFAGDATTFAWATPWILLREMLSMLFPGGSQSPKKKDTNDTE